MTLHQIYTITISWLHFLSVALYLGFGRTTLKCPEFISVMKNILEICVHAHVNV